MTCFWSLLAYCVILAGGATWAQTLAQAKPAMTAAASPSSAPQPIDSYISHAWASLTRSMSDCHSLVDPKVKAAPVLYLPKDLPMPWDVAALPAKCGVHVKRLPVRIRQMGQIRRGEIPTPGLLYLPNRYVVPGGRFNEMYGWDSYFIILGLLRNGRVGLARGIVENFFFEIKHYGGVLNANRTYYFTRSQPPFLSSMVLAVYKAEAAHAATTEQKKQLRSWLLRAYSYERRDHSLWTSPIHRAGNTGLARYFDVGEGPVPEMADDSTYYPDVIRWLLAHPGRNPGYLVKLPDFSTPVEKRKVDDLSCNVTISVVCAHAHVDGQWLTRDFYKGDRSMRESGFDTSFRFGPFSGSTQDFAGVDLNSLLYKYEMDLAHEATLLHKASQAAQWKHAAEARRAAMDRYLWNPQRGLYMDYDFVTHRPSTYLYATTFYPIWAGAASTAQAKAVEKNLKLFEHSGGLAMSTYESGTQWDLPFGWAPVNWITIEGLHRQGDDADARRLAGEFSRTIEQNYERDRTIREKYNVVSGSSQVQVSSGYTGNQIGFGWTNAVYLEMQHLLATTP